MIPALADFFERIPGAGDDMHIFHEKLEHVAYVKGSFLLRTGEVEQYLYFIEKGIIRFWVEQDEKEITFDFAFAGNFAAAYTSFLTRQAAPYHVQALTDVAIWRLTYAHLQDVYTESKHGQLIGRLAAESLFLRKSARELSLLKDTAEERYLNLLQQQPEMIQQIPLKYLASYIGITPQALSRIRQRIS